MGGRVFESLEEVINRYKSEEIIEGFKLKKPVNKQNLFEMKINAELAQKLRERDVYQTLRESREQQRKSRAEVPLTGFLYKKSIEK